MASSPEVQARIVGLGNVILGDEGVGVHVARFLAESGRLPEGVDCLDGGTGGLAMLGLLQTARRLILVDATLDGAPSGTIRRLRPRFARDFPPSLAAHDIGLKDLLDSFYLLGDAPPDVVLFTVSIPAAPDLGMDLSPEVASAVPVAAERVLQELAGGPRGR
jgi:hydrogenase maturation protease